MENQNIILEKTISKLLDEKKYPTLRDILITMNPSDLAGIFQGMEQERIPLLFRLLPKELAAETFVEMDPDAQELLIKGFSDSELKEVIDELYVDDAVDLVEEMPANVVKRVLAQADPDMRKQINEILRYPEDSAGSLMTTEYVSLRPDMLVGTVEEWPALPEGCGQLKEKDCSRVTLLPLMLVAGDHALNDMAGEEADSWKSILTAQGYQVECIMQGLGVESGVQALYCQHLQDLL